MAQQPGRREESTGEADALAEEEEEMGDEGSVEEDEKELGLTEQEMEELRAQVLQLLEELEETRELAVKHEDDSLELQGLLEDERLASARQAEIFTKQIQRLQAQMRTLKDEFSTLQESKESELEQVERELREANEEIHSLRLEAEEMGAIHENEIAALQEQLCRLQAELQRIQQVRNEYETEITTLRAEIKMKDGSRAEGRFDEVAKLQEELLSLRDRYRDLSEEYQTLQEGNKVLVHQLENLEAQRYRRQPRISGSVSFKTEDDIKTISIPTRKQPPSQDEESDSELSLRFQIQSQEEKVHLAQSKCDSMQSELQELQRQYQAIQRERQQLQEELRQCRAEIQRLKGCTPADGRVEPPRPEISLPLIGLVVIVALLWCWWAETAS